MKQHITILILYLTVVAKWGNTDQLSGIGSTGLCVGTVERAETWINYENGWLLQISVERSTKLLSYT